MVWQVVVNKSTQEERIPDTLADFSRELGRLANIRSIAPTQTITSLLVNVYVNVLKFARMATLYYQRNGISGASNNPGFLIQI